MAHETPGRAEDQTNHALTYLALSLGLVWLVKHLVSSRAPANIPPFPAKPYPIIGHLPYFKNGLKDQLTAWRKSTGEIFSVYFGPNLVVILGSHGVLHQAFVKRGDTLSDRPLSVAAASRGRDINRGIVFSSGRVWKEQRSVSLQILRSFGLGQNILAAKISEEVSMFLDSLSKLFGEPTDVRMLIKSMVANNLCSIVVGQRFEYNDERFLTLLHKMSEMFRLGQSSGMCTIFPWLSRLPGDLFNSRARFQVYQYILDQYCYHYIEKTKNEERDLTQDNFIFAYLQEMKKRQQQGQDTTLDEDNLALNVMNMFAAGTDTTSAAISWFMLAMLHYPDVQEKIFVEISEVVGLDRAVTMHDRAKLNYTQAAIMETQRFFVSPLGVPHKASKDTIINGYTIPAGTTVMACIHNIFHCQELWKDPDQYRPERFLDADGNISPPEFFTPFGIGRRVCPGESLAKMELFLVLASVIQRFELRPTTPDHLPTQKPEIGMIYFPQPYQIRFVERR
ncbi:hypothetical protein EGW08_008664 [Elysia chlorotica]|uniref:Cytochrome P450 n=1 Tax=Elysia chlorotica TaxID=188477 RepID=A0A433TPR7_ELYCH|nr:hypothetical protein EGW08_008664 [Elysia chlorotica]